MTNYLCRKDRVARIKRQLIQEREQAHRVAQQRLDSWLVWRESRRQAKGCR